MFDVGINAAHGKGHDVFIPLHLQTNHCYIKIKHDNISPLLTCIMVFSTFIMAPHSFWTYAMTVPERMKKNIDMDTLDRI